jgi:alpha-beta hydrolase superfamily lysophospholipase
MKETIVAFGKTRSLIGIVTHPEDRSSADLPAIILLNSGILHRVGPGRLYVKMARALAAQGFVVLRFDFSGIGDSRSSDEDISFEARTITEVDEAMKYLGTEYRSDKFVLTGICSGAQIAYETQCNDVRVVGAAPINIYRLLEPSDDRLASAVKNRSETRYLLQFSLLNPASWLKLFGGRADYRGILKKINFLLRKLVPANKQEYRDTPRIKSDIRSITDRNAHLLLIYSVTDRGLDFVRETLGNEMNTAWEESGRFRIEVIRANHTFSLPSSQRELIGLMVNWLDLAFKKPRAESS